MLVSRRRPTEPIPYEEILKYARKLSQTTTAPPGFKLQLDDDEGGEEGTAAAAGEQAGQAAKALYQGEQDLNQGKAGQVPPHLQDKLPFPSMHAMRRSVMETPLPTWDAFKQGFLGGDPDEQKQPLDAAGNGRSMPVNTVRLKAPAEDDDDGFGLDLN